MGNFNTKCDKNKGIEKCFASGPVYVYNVSVSATIAVDYRLRGDELRTCTGTCSDTDYRVHHTRQ